MEDDAYDESEVINSVKDNVIEHTLERPLPHIQVQYQPPDEANFWMVCMIGMGCAFVIFVIGSIYLMCKSQKNGQPTPTRRHPNSKSRGGVGGERSAMIRENL